MFLNRAETTGHPRQRPRPACYLYRTTKAIRNPKMRNPHWFRRRRSVKWDRPTRSFPPSRGTNKLTGHEGYRQTPHRPRGFSFAISNSIISRTRRIEMDAWDTISVVTSGDAPTRSKLRIPDPTQKRACRLVGVQGYHNFKQQRFLFSESYK